MALRCFWTGRATYGQWHRMDSNRIAEIVAAENREREEARLDRERREVSQTIEKIFNNDWWSAYERDGQSPEAIQATSTRLLALAQRIADRHWDFYLAELLATPSLDKYFEIALITLKYVCVNDPVELSKCLLAQRDYWRGVTEAHNDLYAMCNVNVERSLPLTPPLNQQQMAKVLGVSPGRFRSQFRAGNWKTKDRPRIHYRKWWHIDRRTHGDALTAIRVKIPEKIWLNNRPEK